MLGIRLSDPIGRLTVSRGDEIVGVIPMRDIVAVVLEELASDGAPATG